VLFRFYVGYCGGVNYRVGNFGKIGGHSSAKLDWVGGFVQKDRFPLGIGGVSEGPDLAWPRTSGLLSIDSG